jgi:plasmid replication initiation protein
MKETQKSLEYVLQPHAISRAMYRISTTTRKIIAAAMVRIPSDFSTLEATFSLDEFCDAIGIERGGKSDKLIQDAVSECFEAVIKIETGKNNWKMFTWISSAECINNKITIKFSEELALYLLELQKMYSKIDLNDIGKLQSFYALRYFELAKSYESLSGKEGNKKGQWFFIRSLPELRQLLGIEPEKYQSDNRAVYHYIFENFYQNETFFSHLYCMRYFSLHLTYLFVNNCKAAS